MEAEVGSDWDVGGGAGVGHALLWHPWALQGTNTGLSCLYVVRVVLASLDYLRDVG